MIRILFERFRIFKTGFKYRTSKILLYYNINKFWLTVYSYFYKDIWSIQMRLIQVYHMCYLQSNTSESEENLIKVVRALTFGTDLWKSRGGTPLRDSTPRDSGMELTHIRGVSDMR